MQINGYNRQNQFEHILNHLNVVHMKLQINIMHNFDINPQIKQYKYD